MPELPEVESVVRALKETSLIGKSLAAIELFCKRVNPDLRKLVSQQILGIERRGKYIHILFSGKGHLIVHLRMTGQFLVKQASDLPSRHERVVFTFSDGTKLAFHDTRRFATFDITSDPESILGKLGNEPLDPNFTPDLFHEIFSTRAKGIKAALLDQKMIAGVGNIYADEALWEAKIHPERLCCELSEEETKRVFKAVRKVLSKGIENGGTSLGNGTPNFHHLNGNSGGNQKTLNAYRREGEGCPRCTQKIVRTIVQQRGTHYCPRCQFK